MISKITLICLSKYNFLIDLLYLVTKSIKILNYFLKILFSS